MKNVSKCQETMIIQQEVYLYHQQSFKLIGTDKQIRIPQQVPQQIDFDGATMFFIVEKQRKAFLNFSLGSLFLTE